MDLTVGRTLSGREYRVRDMSQADYGRLEIQFAELEMPGLMACRTEFGPSQPFKGARITGSLHMTTHAAVFIETLTHLGAEVRWCSSDIFSTDDNAASAIARDSAAVFAWKDETLQEFYWCTERALDWGTGGGPDLIVDDGGFATLLIFTGFMAEKKYSESGKLPDPEAEPKILWTIIRDGLKTDPQRYDTMKSRLVGVSEDTTTGVKRLKQMQNNRTLFFPAFNVNGSVPKSKLCEYCLSLPVALMRATDASVDGKKTVVFGYGDLGKACASAMKEAGALVIVTGTDQVRAIQAVTEGLEVQTLEHVVSDADIFVITSDKKDTIKVDDMKKMKNGAIVCNIGHVANVIDMQGLETYPGVQRITEKAQTDRWVFPETHYGITVLAEGRPMSLGSFVMSYSFTSQVIALLELWKEKASGKYEKKVYDLPEHLAGKVAALHKAQGKGL